MQASVVETWKSLAVQLGLNFELVTNINMPKMSGKYRDHPLVLDCAVIVSYRGGGPTIISGGPPQYGRHKTWVNVTRLLVDLNNRSKATVTIQPGGFLARAIAGRQDIQFGDPLFDKKFIVKGSDELIVREVLDSSIRQQLMEMESLERSFTIKIEGSIAYFEARSLIADSARLRRVLDLVTDLAIGFEKQMG